MALNESDEDRRQESCREATSWPDVSRDDASALARAKDLVELRDVLDDCHRCSLAQRAQHLFLGWEIRRLGSCFIGEAPGRNEDLKGEPFVGAAGQLLDELLEASVLCVHACTLQMC